MLTILGLEDLHHIGTLVAIVSSERQAAGKCSGRSRGISRVQISDFANQPGFFTVIAEPFDEPEAPAPEARALIAHVQNLAHRFAEARGACRSKSRTWCTAHLIPATWRISWQPSS